MASSADSNDIDMPLPVTGGIIVTASPTQHSFRAAACCGRNDNPATEQKDASSNAALPRHSVLAQADAECQPGQSAANNRNGFKSLF